MVKSYLLESSIQGVALIIAQVCRRLIRVTERKVRADQKLFLPELLSDPLDIALLTLEILHKVLVVIISH